MLLSVHLSVCPSVAYVANNSRIQRFSVPTFGRKVPTFDATRTPVSRSKGQGYQAHYCSHIVRHVFLMAKPTNFKLVYGWCTTRNSHRRQDLQGQKSRSQGHVINLSRLGPVLYLCHSSPAGAYRVDRTQRPHLLFKSASYGVTCVQVEKLLSRLRASVGEYSSVSDGAAGALQTARRAGH